MGTLSTAGCGAVCPGITAFFRASREWRYHAPLFLDGGGQQARSLVPLELALNQLKGDQRVGAERRGLFFKFVKALVVGMLVHAFDARIDGAEVDCSVSNLR